MRKKVLELKNITKTFPGVKALDEVSLTLYEGSVLALAGENGAGKSTLIKVITGVHKPDSGEMWLYDKKVSFNDTHDAFDSGISVVHQERNLCDTFTVAENMFLEQITRKSGGIINMKKYNEMAKKYLDMVGLDVKPTQKVTDLKSGQQQLLEIARALSMNAKIIMLDEPTASISVTESDLLLTRVEELRKQGYAFVFVSHKLDEVFRIADDIVVIRDGHNTLNANLDDMDEGFRDKVITAMVGRAESKITYPVRDMTKGEVVLEANEIEGRAHRYPCSFKLHRGEILGWYGLVGAGRTEVARELVGVDRIASGDLIINGKKAVIRTPKQAMDEFNMAYISENRNEEGVFVAHDIASNITSSVHKQIGGFAGWISKKKENAIADEFIKRLSIKTPSRAQAVMNLSGGNRQKVSVAKVLATQPDILIFDEPSVGIDIKTKEEIHDMIIELAKSGISIILISSDMDEMIKIADRITVFNEGKIVDDLENSKKYGEMSEKIMHAIIG